MSLETAIREHWLEIEKVSGPIADIRDEYLKFKGGEGRFMQLAEVYTNLNTVENALFEFLETKKPVFGKKPEREILMIARATIENAKVLLDIVEDEVARMRVQG